MRKFGEDFKKFISKGNIVDLAIAVIIGAAFNKIVTSLVNDVIMPLISLAVGGADVSDWKWVITPAEYDATGAVIIAETSLKYGAFIQTIIDFLIIALFLFIIYKVATYSKKKLEKLSETVAIESKRLKKKMRKQKGEVVEEVVEKVEEKLAEPPKPTNEEIMITLLTDIKNSLSEKKQVR